MSVVSHAAWTIRASVDKEYSRIKICATSDDNDVAEFNLSDKMKANEIGCDGESHSYNLWAAHFAGKFFTWVETDPGTAPDAAYPLAFDNENGTNLLDLASRSTTANELEDAAQDLGAYKRVYDLQIDIGDNNNQWTTGDTITIWIDFE